MTVSGLIDDMTSNMADDGGANILQMKESFNIIADISSTVLGVIATVIVVLIPIIVALELCFINLPVFRLKINNLATDNSKASKVIGVTFRDAILAIDKAECSGDGESTNLIYFKIKVKAIFLAAFMLCVINGLGNVIIQFMLKVVEIIVGVFE